MNQNNFYRRADTGEPVPDDVAETFDAPGKWDTLDPESVPTSEGVIGRLYEGYVDGKRQYVSDRGYATPASHYDHVFQLSDDRTPAVGEGPFTYGDYNVVHHDHDVEHVTKIILVTGHNERTVLNSRSGILWWGYDQNAPIAEYVETMLACSDLSHTDSPNFERADGFESVLTGWHSSIELSKQSEMIDALAKGDVPTEACDDGDPFPYIVKFGDTNNVCSVNASVYGNDRLKAILQEYFDGARAAPRHAGFRTA